MEASESGTDIKRKQMLEKSKKQKALIGKSVDLLPILKERLLNHIESGPNEITRAFQKFKQMGDGLSSEGITLEDFTSAITRMGMRVARDQSTALFFQIAGKSTVIDLPAFRAQLFSTKALNGLGTQAIGQHSSRTSPPRKLAPLSKQAQKKLARIRDDTDMRELIRSKLTERMSGGANELLRAFRSFHSGHGK